VSDPQAEVLTFLEGGALGARPERVDTPASSTTAAGDRAFKLKRAVRFGFMDLATRERREAATRAELDLNRRTAPMLYLRVVPVTREAGGGLALGGTGAPVEWLLEMARFPADAQLDRVAGRGGLTDRLVDALAAEIARLHAAAEPRPDAGGAAAMRAVVDGNAADLRDLAGDVLDRGEVERLVRATAAALEHHATLLDARRAAGLVRRCHADLHLANIVLLDGRPVLFDCLEFDEDLATIDVLYDLAFLLMDLIERGLGQAARRCLQTWNEIREDDAGLALLPLLIAVRAAIRAKVEGFAARLPGAGGPHRDRAAAYLALAGRALVPVPARLVAIGGRSGTGKSTVAAALAPELGAMPGAVVLRSDVIRKRLAGVAPTERLPPDAYAPSASARVFDRLAERAAVLLAAGRAVIADAVWGDPAERSRIAAVARDAGVPFTGVWLAADEALLLARVAARTGDASDADADVVRRQRGIVPPAGWLTLPADRPAAATVAAIGACW
jgi:hypothetical protein